jgi:hypothetical protein
MTESEIIDKVYEDIIAQAAKVLLLDFMVDDNLLTVRHESAERRFRAGLSAAATARDRAKVLIAK